MTCMDQGKPNPPPTGPSEVRVGGQLRVWPPCSPQPLLMPVKGRILLEPGVWAPSPHLKLLQTADFNGVTPLAPGVNPCLWSTAGAGGPTAPSPVREWLAPIPNVQRSSTALVALFSDGSGCFRGHRAHRGPPSGLSLVTHKRVHLPGGSRCIRLHDGEAYLRLSQFKGAIAWPVQKIVRQST